MHPGSPVRCVRDDGVVLNEQAVSAFAAAQHSLGAIGAMIAAPDRRH
jgi:hypothetical protein